MTKYYRYGEMDSCERFWDAFYAAMDRNATTMTTTTTTNGSKTTTTTPAAAKEEEEEDKGGIVVGMWNWKRRREDERERHAFERAWEVVDPAVAKASWTRRYGDVLFDHHPNNNNTKVG